MFRSIAEHPRQSRPPLPTVTLALFAILAIATAVPVTGTTDQDQVTVRPGGVVRWPGSGITQCAMAGREWHPLDEACWYPIDLLREPGPMDLERVRQGIRESATVEVGPYPYPIQRLDVAPEMANPPTDEAERIRREGRRVGTIWNLGGAPAFELPLEPPITPLPEPRSFGALRFFNGEPRNPHGGVDLSAATGTPVRAAASGTVVIAASHYFSGNSVFIDHGDDLITMYFHLDRIQVSEGDPIRTGDIVGTVGSTGRVTGPHLHFGARWHGARIDPMVLLAGPSEPLQSLQ